MTPEAIGTLVAAGVAFIVLLGSILALVFNVGALKGQVTAFMSTSERDRSEILKDIGRIEERIERHVESHGRATR